MTSPIDEAARLQRERPGQWDEQKLPSDANVAGDVVSCLHLPERAVFFPSFTEKPEGVGGAALSSVGLGLSGLGSLLYGVMGSDTFSLVVGVGLTGAAIFFFAIAVRARGQEPIYQNGFYVTPDALIIVQSGDATSCPRKDIVGFSRTSGNSPKTVVEMSGDVSHIVAHRWSLPLLERWRASGEWRP